MAGALSIRPTDPASNLMLCPACGETIGADSAQCRFCLAPIDPQTAQAAARTLARINRACSDASFLYVVVFALPVFFLLSLAPFFWFMLWGFAFLLYVIPVLTVIWWIRFWDLRSNEADFLRARRTTLTIGVIALLLLVLRWA